MPNVNPEVLEWARATAGLSHDDAAAALSLSSPDKLHAIEAGREFPSRPLLLRMSKVYRRSLLTLYLSHPPSKGNRGQDFRTLPPNYTEKAEALVDALIRDVQSRQDLVKATLLEEEEHSPLPYIASCSIKAGRDSVVKSITQTLQFDLATYRAARTADDAFTYLRTTAEEAGIFVLLIGNLGSHHTAIPVEVFRGFAIADPIAPFVVINDQDSKTAWSFTLLHELAHLWLGTTGVSGSRAEQEIEQFCNDVSGETLVPGEDIQKFVVDPQWSDDETIANLANFANDRHVSRQMLAYKLYRHGMLSRDNWGRLDQRIKELWIEERIRRKAQDKGKKSTGPDYYVIRRHRLGRALLKFASRCVDGGTLSVAKAAHVLGVKPRSLYPLLTDIPGSPSSTGAK